MTSSLLTIQLTDANGQEHHYSGSFCLSVCLPICLYVCMYVYLYVFPCGSQKDWPAILVHVMIAGHLIQKAKDEDHMPRKWAENGRNPTGRRLRSPNATVKFRFRFLPVIAA